MIVNKFGHKGTLVAKQKFTFLLNYLSRARIEVDTKTSFHKKIGVEKKELLVNWVEFNLQPTPLSRIYKILLVYIQGYTPYVYVLNPSLSELKKTDQAIPHLYDHQRYKLCLHYPYTNDYNHNEEIGQQYIPWIKHWLYYFEEWLYSGEWKGGGIEPGDEIDKELNPKYKKEDNPLSMKTEIESIQMTIEEANKIYDKRLSKILKESNAAAL